MYGKTETQCKLDLAVSNSQANKAYACSTYYTNSRSAIHNISADILFVYTFSFFLFSTSPIFSWVCNRKQPPS